MNHSFRMNAGAPLAALMLGLVSLQGCGSSSQEQPAAQATRPGEWQHPKTQWGDPDIGGIWTATSMLGTPWQRDVKLGTRAVLNDEEYAQRIKAAEAYRERFEPEEPDPDRPVPLGAGWSDYGVPNRQASLVVDPPDGRIPALTPEARAKEDAWKAQYNARKDAPHSWEDLSTWDRCISLGIIGSITPLAYNKGLEISQGPGYVVLRSEMIHEARVVPLTPRPAVGAAVETHMGIPRGRWEGNTLVIESTNFNGRVTVGMAPGFADLGTLPTKGLRTVERYTRIDNDTVEYRITFDDPATWTAPWTVAYPLRREKGYDWINEYACHEHNIFMYDALTGARAGEKAAASGK
jgi:hypothetical protein